jgi:hypothetical protein
MNTAPPPSSAARLAQKVELYLDTVAEEGATYWPMFRLQLDEVSASDGAIYLRPDEARLLADKLALYARAVDALQLTPK